MPALVYLLALAVFAQGTSEFVLAGLLPAIAGDLDISLGQAGLLTSAFAAGMVVGAPTMAAIGRGWSPRSSLTGFLAAFVLAHVVGALTDSFTVLLVTRVVAAVANAGFLAITLAVVARIAPADRQATGLAVILSGTTLALIVGVPGGALVAGALGWRATLWVIVAICLPALVAVLVATPARADGQSAGHGRLRQELQTLRVGAVQLNITLAVLVNGATFCTFTYLAVIATEAAGFADRTVPGLLAVFGIGAFLGVTAAGRFADRHWQRLISVVLPLLLIGWAAMALVQNQPVAVWALAGVQGALSFALGSTLISRIVSTAQGAPTMAGAFATVALNTGAVIGPVAGGVALPAVGSSGPAWASAALVLMAGGVFCMAIR
ncbi:MAG: Cmx/CmrA family chloramphenicol efflux MFS transporter [Rhodococcus sp. (in: high G+C Gram-positive bacteria)]|uniref:Cmx/CmrA family chloramphenicol efflux MFS transporter n=1 Tax=Rhodococcus sp. TaxID=1831 RepID=UPI002ADA4A8D|nr:Cmx/CmrA family chloramphenicol efflux MFS transporter [Rhodococcus sp. (in: high G+C Gram-positive bacteria)]